MNNWCFLKKICEYRASDSSFDAEVHDVSLTSNKNQLDNSAPLSVTEEKGCEPTVLTTEEQIGQPINKTISQKRNYAGNSSFEDNSNKGRRKRKPDEFEVRMLKAVEGNVAPEDPHLSFFKGLLPSMKDFTNEQFIDFQMGVLQVLKGVSSQNYTVPVLPPRRGLDIQGAPSYQNYIPQVNSPNFHQYPHSSSQLFQFYQPQPLHEPVISHVSSCLLYTSRCV